MKKFDFVVIGGGSAGYAAARTAVAEGLKTAVIDAAETLGGLCILRGCMPSKTLIESGNRNLVIRHAAEFGLEAKPGSANIRAIRDRKRVMIDDFASYRQGQLQDGRFELIRGRASFSAANTLKVTMNDGSEEPVAFRAALIATGSEITIPPMPGLLETGFWTSDNILDAAELPDSFIVLGGGAIALEMAHYLDAVDRKVTVIQRSKGLLTGLDAECGEVVATAMRERGFTVHCGTQVVEVSGEGEQKRVRFMRDGQEHVVEAAEILVATGRQPALEGLGLDNIGLTLDGRAIATNPQMQTSLPHVFAAGDVVNSLEIVHIAITEGETAAKNAAALLAERPLPHAIDYRLNLLGIFCEPQVATVGATEAELTAKGIPFLSASYPFNDHGKSMIAGVKHGFVKMLGHAHTGEILGASVVGPEATELIHEVVVAMHFRATAQQFMSIPHYHPTLSEIWTYPAEEIADEVTPVSHASGVGGD